MRLSITPSLSTKDGTANRNARLTNMLKESSKAGDKAVIRPGLVASDTYSGVGSGLIPFDGRLLVIYDETVYDETLDTYPWPLDSAPWDVGTTYGYGDTIFYGNVLWFSNGVGNIGNTPGSSSNWETSLPLDNYDAGATYGIGDSVTYLGVTYYSTISSNTNKSPSDPLNAGYWQSTPVVLGAWRSMNGWANNTFKATPMEAWVYNTSIGAPTAYGHYLLPAGTCYQQGVADYCAWALFPPDGHLGGNIGITDAGL